MKEGEGGERARARGGKTQKKGEKVKKGVAQLLMTYELVRKRLNPDLSILGVVLTMYDSRNRLWQVKNEVRKAFSQHLFQTIIPRNVRLSEAPSFGKPIITYDIKSRGAEAYLQLAQELVQKKADDT